jgi:hypothetical protein
MSEFGGFYSVTTHRNEKLLESSEDRRVQNLGYAF